MAFDIKVDGETVHTVDIDPRLVTQVSLRTAAGEAGIAGTPFSGEGNDYVNLALIVQQPTALPVVEDDARLAAQEDGPPAEVLTYNPVAQRSEEEMVTNPDGSQTVPTDSESEPEPEAEEKKATAKSSK